ncbi:MAG: bifunctional nicotinamidase/pyrazinamidase [Spirochaetes bacterium]|nr:bifunctional nicotinamidase/pyrazinamidase [Spirochaetota bacterium]
MDSILVVVDLQNDFCPGGTLAVRSGGDIVPRVNKLLALFPLSVLTQDWHPLGHCSFASTWGKAPFSPDAFSGKPGMLWPDHCLAGSPGADFHPGLSTARARLILRKGTNPRLDSYSAFYENDGDTSTGLAAWLSGIGVKRIVIAGLATEYCVRATALDGLKSGFSIDIAVDCVGAVEASPGDGEKSLTEMAAAGCRLLDIEEIRP